MGELEKLEYLSLVSKICTELENHLDINDKDLAEFIISLANKNRTFSAFKTALEANGAQFDDSFIHNLLRLVVHMQPEKNPNDSELKKNSQSTEDVGKDAMKLKFPALAIKDDPTIRIMEELESLLPRVRADVIDLDNLGEVGQKEGTELKEERKREKRSIDQRQRRHSRSRSPRKSGKRSRSRSRDRRNRRRSDSRSPSRKRHPRSR